MKLHIVMTQNTGLSMETTDLNTCKFYFCSPKGLDFWMMLYFDQPAEEPQDDRQIGLKCVHVQMDMWGNFVNLAHQGSVMNRQTGVHLHLVYLATVMDMQISVTLRLVSVTLHVLVLSNVIILSK